MTSTRTLASSDTLDPSTALDALVTAVQSAETQAAQHHADGLCQASPWTCSDCERAA